MQRRQARHRALRDRGASYGRPAPVRPTAADLRGADGEKVRRFWMVERQERRRIQRIRELCG